MSLNIALIGPGLVGKEFLQQIKAFQSKSSKLSLNVIGVMSSRFMKLSENGLTDFDLSNATKANTSEFINFAKAHTPCVIVDCTSSDEIAALYPTFLDSVHLVTPNKKGFSGNINLFESIIKTSKESNTFAHHEATVGAGLPIISTLQDLVATGDEIVKIEGIFSGTLSYIFNRFSQIGGEELLFSEVVGQAKELGYTEPDPRDDLNGMDVARKVVILGRVTGLKLSTDTLAIENIVPNALRAIPDANTFMAQLPNFDNYFADLNREALKENSVLRYVGVVDPKGASSVALKRYPSSHPFASLKGSDNIIAFTTKRFPNPLIVQGAGAGAAVTAFGMFSDILKIARTTVGNF
ncbi:homoserine dehydrogenase-domain-containing protein [Globomyces pollinis-pini]|nr:homoserine dehydrogenase-domain-containing protein [Globomyces pollinis-pini]